MSKRWRSCSTGTTWHSFRVNSSKHAEVCSMSKHDTKGRAWATHADVKERTVVEVGDGFGCIRRGTHEVVKSDSIGRLFIDCLVGRHYLDGQRDYEDGDP